MSDLKYHSSRENGSQKSAILGMIAALIMAGVGYGALAMFWRLETNPVPPGLYDFYAATWGDGLFLSLGCGAFIAYILQRNATATYKLQSTDYRMPAFAGLVGFIIGACIQASWLIRDDIATNWTIPEPHHFTAAGWYHAAYFCFTIAFFCFASCLAARSKLGNPNRSSGLERICEALVGFAAVGYLVMHMHDDYGDCLTSQFGLLLPVLCLVAMFLSVGLFLWRNDGDYVCAVLSGCVFALGISAIVAYDRTFHPSLWLIIVSVALTGASLAFARDADEESFMWRPVILIAAVFGSAICTAATFSMSEGSAASLPLSISTLSWALVAIIALEQCDSNWWLGKERHRGIAAILATACAIAFLAAYCIPQTNEGAGGAVDFLVNTGVLTCVALYSKFAIEPIKQTEQQNRVKQNGEAVGRIQARTYSILGMVAVGTFCLFQFKLFGNTIIDIVALRMSFRLPSPNEYVPSLVGYGVALLAYSALGRKKGSIVETLQALAIAASYCFLFLLATGLRQPLMKDWILVLEMFFGGCGSLYITEQYLSNVALIRRRDIKKNERMNACVLCFGCCATIIGATIPTEEAGKLFYPTILSPLVGVMAVIAASLITPAIIALFSCTREESSGILIQNTPVQGIIQNGLAGVVMFSFLGSFSLSFMSHLGFNEPLNTVLPFISLLLGAHFVISFPLGNNAAFLREAIKKYSSLKESKEKEMARLELQRLSTHFQRITLLVLLTLFPWSLVVWLTAAIDQKRPIEAYLRDELLIHSPQAMLLALCELMPNSLGKKLEIEETARQILKEQGLEE